MQAIFFTGSKVSQLEAIAHQVTELADGQWRHKTAGDQIMLLCLERQSTHMKQVVHTDQAPKAIGPYSQAIKANGLLFISGQLPVEPITGETAEGGVAEQTRQSLENLKAILAVENLTFANAVKATVFLKDIKDFAAMNEIYGIYFTKEPPARVCVQAAKLPKNVLVEIDLIAVY